MTYTFSETTLDNGLRIAAEHSTDAVTSAIGFFVKTGARDETTSLMGVSHFLEHMMFKGTDSLSAEQVDLAFDNIGAEHNAFTSGEMTAFWGAGLPEVLGDIHDTLVEILRPALRQEDFDNEKKVILEEIAMYDDQAILGVVRKCNGTILWEKSTWTSRFRNHRKHHEHEAR